jgi:dsDNA-specific endonuclease/ATPase MutS2
MGRRSSSSDPPNPFEPLSGPIADTLDLHGMRASEALPAVTAFLQRAQRRAPGALVHIITGKGRGSPGRPVLKTRVRTHLRSAEVPVADFGVDLDGGGYIVRLR